MRLLQTIGTALQRLRTGSCRWKTVFLVVCWVVLGACYRSDADRRISGEHNSVECMVRIANRECPVRKCTVRACPPRVPMHLNAIEPWALRQSKWFLEFTIVTDCLADCSECSESVRFSTLILLCASTWKKRKKKKERPLRNWLPHKWALLLNDAPLLPSLTKNCILFDKIYLKHLADSAKSPKIRFQVGSSNCCCCKPLPRDLSPLQALWWRAAYHQKNAFNGRSHTKFKVN